MVMPKITTVERSAEPTLIECRINGRITPNICKDIANIKCPICGTTMKLSRLEESKGEDEEWPMTQVRNCLSYAKIRIHEYHIGVTCPDCQASLSLIANEVLRVGWRYVHISEQ